MIDDQLLEAFMSGFYGFGDYQASYRFVGIEEGGGNTVEAIVKQLRIWDLHERKELLELPNTPLK